MRIRTSFCCRNATMMKGRDMDFLLAKGCQSCQCKFRLVMSRAKINDANNGLLPGNRQCSKITVVRKDDPA